MKRQLILILIFILGLPLTSFARPDIRASVDRTQIGAGESLQLSISINGDKGDVDISPIKDFKVMSQGTTSSINMINGNFSQELIYKYTLIPLKQGRLKIPPLQVISGQHSYYTQEIIINVSENTQANSDNREVFIQSSISNINPYEGQQLIYTFKFFQSVQTANAKIQQLDFSGFTSSKIEEDKNYKTNISGKLYHVTELNYVLIPLKPGQITIEPAVLSCDIVKRSNRRRSIFDDPFFGGRNLESRVYRSRSFNVNVKPLPPYNNENEKFSGLVGKFDIQSHIETKELKVGDSITLSLSIQGTGNIMDAEEPEISVPDAFKVYKDAPEEAVQLGLRGYFGKKIFRMALVPVHEGEYNISPVKLVYFDISSKKYITKQTSFIKLKVNPSAQKDNLEVFSSLPDEKKSLKKKVEFTGRDILPVKEDLDALKNQKTLSIFNFTIFMLCPAILCVLLKFIIIFTKTNNKPSHIMAQRADKAIKDACQPKNSAEEFLSCLYKTITSIILSKTGSMGESLTYAEAENILQSKGYPQETAVDASKLLEKIELAKFGGLAMNEESRKKLLQETKQMFRTLS